MAVERERGTLRSEYFKKTRASRKAAEKAQIRMLDA